METPVAMDSQEEQVNQEVMPHQHQPNNPEDRVARSAHRPRTAPQDHPDHREDQDSQEDQDRTLKEADPAQPDLPDHPDQLEDPETTVSQEDPARPVKCTMCPAVRDQPVHPDPMDSPAVQDSQEAMDTQERLVHPDHPETMARPEALETQEDPEAMDSQEVREAMALATTAHLHVPPPAIKPAFHHHFSINNTLSKTICGLMLILSIHCRHSHILHN